MGSITPINPQVVFVSASTPDDKTEGKLWYNTSNNNLYTSNGTSYVLLETDTAPLIKHNLEQDINILINSVASSSSLNGYDLIYLDILTDSDGADDTIDTGNTTAYYDASEYKNGSSTESDETVASDTSYGSNGNQTAPTGIGITTNEAFNLNSVTKTSGMNCTRCLVGTSLQGSEVGTATFVGDTATFSTPLSLSGSTTYSITMDKSGASYTSLIDTNVTYNQPTGNEFDWAGRIDQAGSPLGGDGTNGIDGVNIGTTIVPSDLIVQTDPITITTDPISHFVYCHNSTSGTASITYDISFDGGTTWVTDQPLNTTNTGTHSGTSMILKINLNGTGAGNEASISDYAVALAY